ncbi:unnamed protein product [Parnassius apollo]|uniref:(apollo) hypothetical protein n=1 Tax=Parnassius apollo TaxID=110799 RepID=A0A8S3WCJ8_PARAO|nr:unnamed protein product [Parnassius apollo]
MSQKQVEGVVVGTDTLEEKERTERADELNQPPLKEIETVIIEDETPISKHPMIMPMPPQTQENPLKISSVNSMKSVEPIPSNLLNVAVGADGFLYILPSSGVPVIPQQLTVQQLETCSYTSQINSVNNGVISGAENRTMVSANNGLMSSAENGAMVSINNGVISRVENRTMESVNNRLMSSAEKRSTVPAKQKSKRPRQLEDDPSRGTSDDDVILIGDEEPEAQEQVVKYPIRIDSKVDWEDKIPIDIISFVDSKSSNVTSKVKGPKISLHKNIQTNM